METKKTERKQYEISKDVTNEALFWKTGDTLVRIEGQLKRLRWFQKMLDKHGLRFEVQRNDVQLWSGPMIATGPFTCIICGNKSDESIVTVRVSWSDTCPDIGDNTTGEVCNNCVKKFVPEIIPELQKVMEEVWSRPDESTHDVSEVQGERLVITKGY